MNSQANLQDEFEAAVAQLQGRDPQPGISGKFNGKILTISENVRRIRRARQKDSFVPHGAKIGDVMEDGTIYGDISPSTGKPLFIAPRDAPSMNWHNAIEYASTLSDYYGWEGSAFQAGYCA